MYKSIMVPLDGSAFGELALPTAVRFALANGAALNLVHVHSRSRPDTYLEAFTPFAFEGVPDSRRLRDDEVFRAETDYLSTVAARIDSRIPVTSTELSMDASVSHGLYAVAGSLGTDLIIMTTHRNTPFQKLLYGSVGDSVVRELHLPTILIPAREDNAPPEPAEIPRKVLVTLDGSPFAEEVLEHAVDAARALEAEITLLGVADPIIPHVLAPATMAPPFHNEPFPLDVYLAGLQRELGSAGVRVSVQIVNSWHPAVAILDYAKSARVDLIAMATHGRSGASRVFFGSVAQQVVTESTHPVLLIRPQHKAAHV